MHSYLRQPACRRPARPGPNGMMTLEPSSIQQRPQTCQPEKRKVGSSTLPLTTSFGLVSSALTSANADWALPCLQPSSDHDCPCVTVVGRSLSHADRTPCLGAPGSRPLRPELAAPLGVWPSSQLAECAAGRRCWRLCGDVAVLPCCTVYRISSSGRGCPDRFKLDRFRGSVFGGRCCTAVNCNPKCNPWPSPAARPRQLR